MREAKTPFLRDEGKHGPARHPTKPHGPRCVWSDYVTPDTGPDAEPTLGGDGASSKSPDDDEVRGQLADAAASVLMKNPLGSQNGEIRSAKTRTGTGEVVQTMEKETW